MVTLQDVKEMRYIREEILSLCEREREIARRISDGEDGAKALEKVRAELSLQRQRLAKREAAATAYIGTVPDGLMRLILTYRFIEGLSWLAVARRIGGVHTADSVKKAFYRFWAAEIRKRK